MARTEEQDFQYMILRVMEDGRIWTNARLKDVVGKAMELSSYDRARAAHRHNEAKYEQIVNNALSPSRKSSLYGQGALTNVSRGHHQINDVGRLLLANLRQQEATMDAAFSSVFGESYSFDKAAERITSKGD